MEILIKIYKSISTYLFIFLFLFAISFLLAFHYEMHKCTVFNTLFLFTFYGVLAGFSITIYTFALSMINEIVDNINNNETLKDSEKTDCIVLLRNGFQEIKEDIWIIFFSLVLVSISEVFEFLNIRLFDNYKILGTLNIFSFFISLASMFDMVKTLFNLSNIKIELIHIKKK